MKFYDCRTAPSPRRVRMFLSEKGMDVPVIQVDLRAGQQFSDEFRAKNPRCTVPVLELDDGTCLCETLAICHFVEKVIPEPVLMGRDAREQALVIMWNQRLEFDGFGAIADAFRNSARGLHGRAMTGATAYQQIPALADRGRQRAEEFLRDLDDHLAQRPFIALDRFSMADLTAFVIVEFARWIKMGIPEECSGLRRWYDETLARPSALV